jgi:hypothetical protein
MNTPEEKIASRDQQIAEQICWLEHLKNEVELLRSQVDEAREIAELLWKKVEHMRQRYVGRGAPRPPELPWLSWSNAKAIASADEKTPTKPQDAYKSACDQYSEDEMLGKLAEVTKQRDALAEAGNQLLDSLYSQDWRKLPAIRNMRKALAATKGGSDE